MVQGAGQLGFSTIRGNVRIVVQKPRSARRGRQLPASAGGRRSSRGGRLWTVAGRRQRRSKWGPLYLV